jgi:hypothetical protein
MNQHYMPIDVGCCQQQSQSLLGGCVVGHHHHLLKQGMPNTRHMSLSEMRLADQGVHPSIMYCILCVTVLLRVIKHPVIHSQSLASFWRFISQSLVCVCSDMYVWAHWCTYREGKQTPLLTQQLY